MKYQKPGLFSTSVAALLIIVVVQSCVDHTLPETEIDTCGGTVSYINEVKPIVDTSCAIPGCHNGDNGADRNWTVFSNFQAKSSSVKDRITRPPGAPGHMPLVGSITVDEIQAIVCWVDQGAKDN
jgi:hypothetical protein